MSPGTPNRIPLAMKLWLFRQRSGAARAASAQSADRIMSIESLEHIMRSRVRMIVRHTWLLAILGTAIVVGLVWVGFYISTEAERMRIAAGPTDANLVQALSDELAQLHRILHRKVVPDATAQDAANVIKAGKAELVILPSTADSSLK